MDVDKSKADRAIKDVVKMLYRSQDALKMATEAIEKIADNLVKIEFRLGLSAPGAADDYAGKLRNVVNELNKTAKEIESGDIDWDFD